GRRRREHGGSQRSLAAASSSHSEDADGQGFLLPVRGAAGPSSDWPRGSDGVSPRGNPPPPRRQQKFGEAKLPAPRPRRLSLPSQAGVGTRRGGGSAALATFLRLHSGRGC
ncbi:UNVERIFIED_CONTAM: hypothetical protein K2H54_057478, partial [Gekko kuhli]